MLNNYSRLYSNFIINIATILAMTCQVFAATTTELTKPKSHSESSNISLVHVILESRGAQRWIDRFLNDYVTNQQPPAEWFNIGNWNGVMVIPIPRIDNLDAVNMEWILKQSFFFRNASEDEIKKAMETTIVFVANPKKESVWLSGLGKDDQELYKIKKDWYKNPKNWFRKNTFSLKYRLSLFQDPRILFRESALLDDFKVIGHVKDPVGDFGMYSGIITNGDQIESSKIYIPAIYTDHISNLEIYFVKPESCHFLF